MASYPPPTEDLAIFDNIVFSSGDEFLTRNQADKRYLRFPSAQGTENLQDTNVNGLLTLNSDLDITQNSEIKWDNILNNYLINQRLPKAITTGGRNISLGHSALHDVNTGNDNIAIGFGAGEKINSGNDNICIGTNAGNALTTGIASVLIGERAGYKTNLTTCAIGRYALENLTSGQYNVAIGEGASRNTTSGFSNVIVGYNANQSGNGANQTAIGAFSLEFCAGTSNTAIGSTAGRNITTGSSNTMIGEAANESGNTTLNYSCAIGKSANNANFSNSVALGYQSTNTSANQIRLGTATETVSCPGGLTFRLTSDNTNGTYYIPFTKTTAGTEGGLFIDDTTGPLTYNPSNGTLSFNVANITSGLVTSTYRPNGINTASASAPNFFYGNRSSGPSGGDNVCIGQDAGNVISTGTGNICMANSSGKAITSGGDNVCLSYQAGSRITTGGHNICIGNGSGFSIVTSSGNVCIGQLAGNLSTQANNVFIGYTAGNAHTTGGNVVCIGAGAVVGTTATGGTALGYTASTANFGNSTALGIGATCTSANQIRLGTASETVSCPGIVQSPRYDAPSASTLVDYAKTSTTGNIIIGESLTSGEVRIGPQISGSPSSNVTIMPRGGWTGTFQVGGNSASAKMLCATNLEVSYPIQTSTTTAPTTIRQLGYTTTKTTGWTATITSTQADLNSITIDNSAIAYGVYNINVYLNYSQSANGTVDISVSTVSATAQSPLTRRYSPASVSDGILFTRTISAYATTTFYVVGINSVGSTATLDTAGTDQCFIELTRIA